MAVHGNRLAEVTADVGLVVWELSNVITDNIACVLIILILIWNELNLFLLQW